MTFEENIKWFKSAKYGMMVHFGLYSLMGGVYKGKRSVPYAEWAEYAFQIPNKEIEQLATAFNPVFFDAEEWVKTAKDAGMNYIVITTKHHEGFALFKSYADKFNVVDSSPFKRDIIKELSEACHKYGLKLGLYYSQDLDWHEENGGGYKEYSYRPGRRDDNSWDFPNREKKDYHITFKNKILPQVKELLTNYGEISLMWFDVPFTISKEETDELYKLVKELQPQCLVNSRIGNDIYDYVSLGDNEIPENFNEIDPDKIDYTSTDGFKPSRYNLYESACTLNDTWGYSSFDYNFKKPEDIYNNLVRLNNLGINYLINVGPDNLGRIPQEEIDILTKVKQMLDKAE